MRISEYVNLTVMNIRWYMIGNELTRYDTFYKYVTHVLQVRIRKYATEDIDFLFVWFSVK
jgi:hypothetical protein